MFPANADTSSSTICLISRPQPHPPRVKQGKNLPPWGREANSSMLLGAAELAPDWEESPRPLGPAPRPCSLPGQPPALPSPCQPQEEQAFFLSFWGLNSGSSQTPVQRSAGSGTREAGRRKLRGASWLSQRQAAWKVTTRSAGWAPGFVLLGSGCALGPDQP